MEDYQGNPNKDKLKLKPAKKVEKVVASEVVIQKKSLGRKIHDVFIEADFKSVVRYVVSDVLIPAARNMIVDASSRGVERLMYGENAARRRGITYGAGPRVSYNSPINRGVSYRDPRVAPPISRESRTSRHVRDEIIISSREEAEKVLEVMNEIIDQYEVASVQDLNDLVGLASTHTDQKWGWVFLGDAQIQQVREGYFLNLPPAEPIS